MTQAHIQTQSVPFAEPVALPYQDAPTGGVLATEATMRSLAKTRPWAMACAVGLFVYAMGGVTLGVMALVALKKNAGRDDFPVWLFIAITSANLLFAPIALVGGLLAVRHHAAAGRAHARRNPADLERALVAQLHVWRWGAAAVAALFALPFLVFFVAALMDLWP